MNFIKSITFASIFIAVQQLQAVIINTPDGGSITYHESTPPAADTYNSILPFDNILNVNGSSGVYLGGGWVLTAKHVYNTGSASVTHNGTSYSVDTNVTLDFSDPAVSTTIPEVDLRLFRLDTVIPGLPTISIGSVSLADAVTMIGRGGGAQRWGTNQVEDKFQGVAVNDGTTSRHVVALTTDYDEGTTGEAHAVTFDSGGGIFHHDGSNWILAGIMTATNDSVDPNISYSAQLDYYQTAIEDHITANGSASTIPEPSSGALVLIASFGFIMRRTRTR